MVGDSLNHRVQILTSDGRFVREFGNNGYGDGQFDMPGGVAMGTVGTAQRSGADEHILVTDQGNGRVQVFTRDGEFVRCIGRAGTLPGCLMEPTGVAITPGGDVVVADYQNHRVQVFSGTGEVVRVIGRGGSAEGEFNHPSGLAVTPAGDIIVADYQVRLFVCCCCLPARPARRCRLQASRACSTCQGWSFLLERLSGLAKC